MLCVVLCVCLLLFGAVGAQKPEGAVVTKGTERPPGVTTKAPERSTSTSRAVNNQAGNYTLNDWNLNDSMIQRALYVLIGITIIGVLYFLVRAVRLKKTTQRKKYGLLSNYDDSVEMAQLESDEEDTTVYEAKTLRR